MTARCGKWMPNAGEPCARGAGHGYECRTQYALDNDAPLRRLRPPSTKVVLGPCPCKRCGRMLTWDGWEWQENGYRHDCYDRRLARARVRDYNQNAGVSGQSHSIASGRSHSLTPGGGRLAASVE